MFEQLERERHARLSEVADFGKRVFTNWKKNRVPYRDGMSMEGIYSGVPALIVGAGPSVDVEKIKEYKNRALIMAGGAAMTLPIPIDFGAAVDPRVSYECKAPVCYQARAASPGDILFPDGYWKLGERFESGWTVGNFMVAVAEFLGCNPIYVVGMDFCYKDGKKYQNMPNDEEAALIEVDGLLTKNDWLLAARWMEMKNILNLGGGIMRVPKVGYPDLPLIDLQRELPPILSPQEWDEEEVKEKMFKQIWEEFEPLHRDLFYEKVMSELG